jgi:chemotaxis protein CheD
MNAETEPLSIYSASERCVVVPMAAARHSTDRAETLVTYALGSCLGITVWDPLERVGGLLHVMLPDSATSPDKAAANPEMFLDTAVPRLFKRAYALGAVKQRLVVCVAGGASLGAMNDGSFQIGQRNVAALRKILWKNGVLIKALQVGGTIPRTLALKVETGDVLLKTEHGVSILPREV